MADGENRGDGSGPDKAGWLVRQLRMLAEAGPGLVVGIIAILLLQYTWDALFHPHVILEALSVPKELEEKGLTGQVIASRLIDHMKYMEMLAERPDKGPSPQTQPPETPFKVQISGAGVSIDELGAYLRSLVSHDTYLSGEIVGTGNALDFRLRKTVRENSEVICTLEANGASWENDIAGCLYQNLQPDRYARFLLNWNDDHGAKEEDCSGTTIDHAPDRTKIRARAEQYFEQALASTTADHERAWALEGLGYQKMHDADFLREREKCGQGVAGPENAALEQFNAAYGEAENDFIESLTYNPHFVVTLEHLAELEGNIGRDEASYRYTQRLVSVMVTDPLADGTLPKGSPAYQVLLDLYQAGLAEAIGDYEKGTSLRNAAVSLAAKSEDIAAKKDTEDTVTFKVNAAFLHQEDCCAETKDPLQLAGLEKWGDILTRCTDSAGLTPACPDPMEWPWIAKAYSQTGNQKKAMAIVNHSLDATAPGLGAGWAWPTDRARSWCYLCWRIRAQIEANSNDLPAAIADMKHAISLAPSLPFAYVELANIYRRERNLDAAASQARWAVRLGPGYADALEIWGRILMDRRDYAAADEKFSQAIQIAPQWRALRQERQEAQTQAAKSR